MHNDTPPITTPRPLLRDVCPVWLIAQRPALTRLVWRLITPRERLAIWRGLSREGRVQLLATLGVGPQRIEHETITLD